MLIILFDLNHEKFLQRALKSTVSQFDDKMFYESKTKSKPWNYCYQMVVKQKEKLEKNRHVENNDKFNKYILRGERNVKYYDRIQSKSRKRNQKTQRPTV